MWDRDENEADGSEGGRKLEREGVCGWMKALESLNTTVPKAHARRSMPVT